MPNLRGCVCRSAAADTAVGWTEVFLEEAGAGRSLELHRTPENQRLQLLFRHGDIERFRASEASLESFLVDDPHWVASETEIGAGFWAMRTILPASIFGGGPLATGRRFLMNAREDVPFSSATHSVDGLMLV